MGMSIWVRLGVMHSSAIQFRTRPESSSSFMVRLPDVNIPFTVCGHYNCQMIGPIVLRTDVWNAPVKIPHLSEYLTEFDNMLTSSRT